MGTTHGASEITAIRGIESRIVVIRHHRVLLDADLAAMYGVTTKALNQAVKRNQHRFPADFAFRLTQAEASGMRSQIVTASRRNIRHLPKAFTEQGAIMAANVLNSRRAEEVSVFVVRAFVRLRSSLDSNRALALKLDALEGRVGTHDRAIRELVAAIRNLAEQPVETPGRRIGFRANDSHD